MLKKAENVDFTVFLFLGFFQTFSKFGATSLAKICAIKVQEGVVEIETIEKEVEIDVSVEEYLKEIKQTLKRTKKALIKLNNEESNQKK